LQAHKAAFREVFGETLSDEFVDEMLTRLVTALAPGPWDTHEAATLNAAIALIASVKPQTELEALLAVQIAATGFASLKFLQLGQRHLEDAYIDVYGTACSGGETGSTDLDSSPGLESKHDATQIAHAPQPAMRSPNAEPKLVPSAGDAERPMPDARGNVPGSTEGE
jgi:hypothetical protein